jgi:uncharacterized membrane protein YbhN (UPF0104 family)
VGEQSITTPKRKISVGQIVAFVFGVLLVVVIFVFAIPKFADYGDIWDAMKTLTPLELWSLIALMVFNLYSYWLANQAGLIGLRIWPSAVVTQTSTTVANTMPAGGALAVGVTAAQLASWGFTAGEITLFVGVTGLWNIFAKLAMPAIALALLVVTGSSTTGLLVGAVIGIVALIVAVGVLALVFSSERMARRVGDLIGRVLNGVRRAIRKPPIQDMGDRSVRFRRETVVLTSRRWIMLTWTTLLSQIALFLVLLLSLRHMGVSEQDVSTVEAFAVYTFARLASAIPVTPGGVGVIDLAYIAGLALFDTGEHAEIIAAVLIFRVLTYGIQIPIGAATYFVWRAKKSWRRDTPPAGSIAAELGYVPGTTDASVASGG